MYILVTILWKYENNEPSELCHSWDSHAHIHSVSKHTQFAFSIIVAIKKTTYFIPSLILDRTPLLLWSIRTGAFCVQRPDHLIHFYYFLRTDPTAGRITQCDKALSQSKATQ